MPADGIHPEGPAQPSLQQGYETKGNNASQEPAEKATADANAADNSQTTDKRIPTKQTHDQSEATPSSLGLGVRGAPPGEEAEGKTEEDVGRNQELDAEQMGAPGEGKVASAVDRKPGAGGKQPGLEVDLDKKKSEQAADREEVQSEKKKELDVAGILANRGGPVNPVGKNNYPN